MTVCVVRHPGQDRAVRLHAAEERVATRAQKAAHFTCAVTVIHKEVSLNIADQAAAVLRLAHHFNVIGSKPVLSLQSRADVLRARSLWIITSPLAQARVALLLVVLGVLPRHLVAAVLAVRAAIGAVSVSRSCVLLQRKLATALCADLGLHASSITRRRDMTTELDSPCHADVLLEIANRECHG